MPNRRCWVPNCKNSKSKEAVKTRLYGFPRDAARCRQWLKAVGDENLAKLEIQHLANVRYICKDHFLPSKITPLGRAVSDAVPVIFKDLRPPLSDECLKEFDERSNNVKEPIVEQVRNVSEHQYVKPQDTDPPASYGPASIKILCKSLGVHSLHKMLTNGGVGETNFQQNMGENVSSNVGDFGWNFILPRITQVQSLAKTISPAEEETYNVNSVIKTEDDPTYDDIIPASAIDSSIEKTPQDDLPQKGENILVDDAPVSVIETSPEESTAQDLPQNPLNGSCEAVSSSVPRLRCIKFKQIFPRISEVRSLATTSGSTSQATCKSNSLQETSKEETNKGVHQTLCGALSSSVCKPKRTTPRILLIPRCQGSQQIVWETVSNSDRVPQQMKRKTALVPHYASTFASVSPPEKTRRMVLHHIQYVPENNDDSPVSSPEEINPNDNVQEDTQTCDPVVNSSLRLTSGGSMFHGHGGKMKATDEKCESRCKNISVKVVLSGQTLSASEAPMQTLKACCQAVRMEDVHRKKEAMTQVKKSMQPGVKDTSQKKETKIQEKKSMQTTTNTRWKTINLAMKEKWSQRRATEKQKKKAHFSTESIWRTVNMAMQEKWETIENVLNEKKKKDKEALEKRWNQLEDRVNQLIEDKVEKTVNQVIEYQLENKVNQIIEKKMVRKESKTVEDPIEKRISHILEAKIKKIEQRVTEVVDKKLVCKIINGV